MLGLTFGNCFAILVNVGLMRPYANKKGRRTMNIRMLVFMPLFLLLCLGLSGCKQEVGDENIVGTWMNAATEGYSWKSIVLHADGTAELIYWNDNTAGSCMWKISNEKLIVTDESGKNLIDLSYKLRSKTKLVLTGTPENVVMTGDGTYEKK
jgi:hypothetical protein